MSTHLPDAPAGVEPSDADLLRACADGDRAVAVEAIVHRHGRTVLAVCRGILGDGADADDAFQATFLVLLHRADSVRRPNALGGWLCGVATRIARRARQQRAHGWAREAVVMTPNGLPDPAPSDPAVTALDRETCAVVWAELGGLPDTYRDPVVLCHMEGRTTEEAAAALRCPVGTLRSRLLKARSLLGTRLARRGLTLSAATAVAVVTQGRATADPPKPLIQRTTAAATGGAVPPAVSLHVEGVMREMKTNWWPAAVLTTLLGAGAVLAALTVGPAAPAPSTNPSSDEKPAAAAARPTGPGTLLVVSQRDAIVALIDPVTGKVRATVPTDPCPHEVAVSPDGKTAAVANYGLPFGTEHGHTVTLIDVAAGKKLKTIDTGADSAPHGLHWLTDTRLLCTTEKADAVVEIDTAQGKVVRTIRTDQKATHMVTAAADEKRAYTANILSGTVSAIDLGDGAKLKDGAAGKGPEGIAVSPDGKRVWVGNRGDKTIAVLKADDLSVLKTLPAPGVPLRVVFTPDGKTVLSTEIMTGELSVFDAETMVETKRIKLTGGPVVFDTPGPPPGPAAVAVSPDGKTAYCTMFFSKAVAVVDLTNGAVTGKIALPGGEPDGVAFSPVGPKE